MFLFFSSQCDAVSGSGVTISQTPRFTQTLLKTTVAGGRGGAFMSGALTSALLVALKR